MKTKTIVALAMMAGSLVAFAQTNPSVASIELGSDAKSASSNVPGNSIPRLILSATRSSGFVRRAPRGCNSISAGTNTT